VTCVNARQRFGRAAEEAAAHYFISHGWLVLGRNVRIGRGELDLIVRRAGVLAFVEVKARRSVVCGSPEDAVGPRKQRQIARLAGIWLAARPWALTGIDDVRYDIVAVDATLSPAAVRHLPAAFTSGW
jgi:putative endonuclease